MGKSKKNKSSNKIRVGFALAGASIITAGAGIGIGYAIWHDSKKPTPTPPPYEPAITAQMVGPQLKVGKLIPTNQDKIVVTSHGVDLSTLTPIASVDDITFQKDAQPNGNTISYYMSGNPAEAFDNNITISTTSQIQCTVRLIVASAVRAISARLDGQDFFTAGEQVSANAKIIVSYTDDVFPGYINNILNFDDLSFNRGTADEATHTLAFTIEGTPKAATSGVIQIILSYAGPDVSCSVTLVVVPNDHDARLSAWINDKLIYGDNSHIAQLVVKCINGATTPAVPTWAGTLASSDGESNVWTRIGTDNQGNPLFSIWIFWRGISVGEHHLTVTNSTDTAEVSLNVVDGALPPIPIQDHTLTIRQETAELCGINVSVPYKAVVGYNLAVLKPIINDNSIDRIIFDGFSGVFDSAFKDCELFETESTGCKIKHIEFKQTSALLIESNAFRNCSALEDVKVSNASSGPTINSIGNYAFMGCTYLTGFIDNVVTVKGVGSFAFCDCTHLSYVGIHDNLSLSVSGVTWTGNASGGFWLNIGNAQSTNSLAQYGCLAFGTIWCPSGLLQKRNTLFYGCASITSIISDETATLTLSQGTFADCTMLRELSAPGLTISTFGDSVFENCSNLQRISFAVAQAGVSFGNDVFKGLAFSGEVTCSNFQAIVEKINVISPNYAWTGSNP